MVELTPIAEVDGARAWADSGAMAPTVAAARRLAVPESVGARGRPGRCVGASRARGPAPKSTDPHSLGERAVLTGTAATDRRASVERAPPAHR
jgi:hypothetical protein